MGIFLPDLSHPSGWFFFCSIDLLTGAGIYFEREAKRTITSRARLASVPARRETSPYSAYECWFCQVIRGNWECVPRLETPTDRR